MTLPDYYVRMTSKRNEDEEFEPDPATWTAIEERVFIHLMVKEVHKGNRSATTFSRKGWRHIEDEFHQRTSKRYTNSQFRNKFNQLRTRYNEFIKLLNQPGFNYDPILNTVIAADEVWANYTKVNKHAKRFRKKGCPFFNELEVIFGEQDLKYKDVYPLTIEHYDYENGEDKLDMEDDASTNDTPSAFPSNSSDGEEDYHPTSILRRRQRSPTPTSHFRAKREFRLGGVREWGDGEAIKGRSPTVTPSVTPIVTKQAVGSPSVLSGSSFSITKCVKCLESIEGVDGSTYLKALKMFKDPDWREMFMAMSSDRRLVWLASLE